MRPTDDTVTRAKGLAIILVVVGHLVPRAAPPGVAWYETLRGLIYLFHMPLFMVLSGYVAEYSRPIARVNLDARARRLLIPFIIFGLAITVGKLLLSRIVPVDHAPVTLGAALGALFVWTDDSPALSVWYLAVLFACWAVTKPLLRAAGNRLWLPAAVALAAFAAPLPPIAYADRFSAFYVFFVAGLAAGRARAHFRAAIAGHGPTAIGVLALALALCAVARPWIVAGGWQPTDRPYAYALVAMGLLSVPAVLHLAERLRFSALLRLGEASLAIYLLNTIGIGLAKSAMLTVLPWDAAHFPLFVLALFAAGLAFPLAAQAAWRAGTAPSAARAT